MRTLIIVAGMVALCAGFCACGSGPEFSDEPGEGCNQEAWDFCHTPENVDWWGQCYEEYRYIVDGEECDVVCDELVDHCIDDGDSDLRDLCDRICYSLPPHDDEES